MSRRRDAQHPEREPRLDIHNWPYLWPVVQHAINHTSSKRLTWKAPFTVMVAKRTESPLDHILNPDTRKWCPVSSDSVAKRRGAEGWS